MPAAINKAGLLEICRKEFEKLSALIAEIPDAAALAKDEDDVSIKDVIGHRAHWVELYLGWRADGLAGLTPDIPAPGYKWSQLKAYNAQLRVAQAELGWMQARALLAAAHHRLMAALEEEEEAALYDGPMPGGGSKWTTGRWAEAAGASHYRSAAKYVRARLRGM